MCPDILLLEGDRLMQKSHMDVNLPRLTIGDNRPHPLNTEVAQANYKDCVSQLWCPSSIAAFLTDWLMHILQSCKGISMDTTIFDLQRWFETNIKEMQQFRVFRVRAVAREGVVKNAAVD